MNEESQVEKRKKVSVQVKRKPRAVTVLRELAERVGTSELARRTGYAESTLRRAIRTGKLSEAVREEIRAAHDRSERARAGARTRAAKKTRLDFLPPEKAGELAKATGVSERTARGWIKKGGTPPTATDAAKQIAAGVKAYSEPEPGSKRALEPGALAKLEHTMREFVEAVRERRGGEEISAAYRAWRRAKLPARSFLDRAAWAAFVERMGEELDLPDTGTFSKERFRKS